MYLPRHFQQQDAEAIKQLMRDFNFATVVTVQDGSPVATHVPLVVGDGGPHGVLRGHLARANPQWRSFDGEQEALVIFQGPHAYISPSWYETAPAVPTWNYAVVHAYGKAVARDDVEWLDCLLHDLVGQHDQEWRIEDVPGDFVAKLKEAIVGFEIPISRLEAKWKLNQHRPAGDRLGPADALAGHADSAARQLAELMRSARSVASS